MALIDPTYFYEYDAVAGVPDVSTSTLWLDLVLGTVVVLAQSTEKALFSTILSLHKATNS